ncbi:hypothetical protein FSS13T_15550 [Flavobacterium saliperosum S13]|uniref:ATP synthase F0 subunit 8 n=1 Tax=Flavobacterium saliperosum S13 TaxID=1341155 RepID=A0ABN0QGJ8_9FLAO|nr:hypothetical protein FSS13T_15550 [Flavobacterium saliperosum S13]
MVGWGFAVVAIVLMIYNLFCLFVYFLCSEKSKQIYVILNKTKVIFLNKMQSKPTI